MKGRCPRINSVNAFLIKSRGGEKEVNYSLFRPIFQRHPGSGEMDCLPEHPCLILSTLFNGLIPAHNDRITFNVRVAGNQI